MGEPHDPTNGDGVNQDGENEQPWTPSGFLDLGQNDQDGQVTLVSCDYVATHANQLRGPRSQRVRVAGRPDPSEVCQNSCW